MSGLPEDLLSVMLAGFSAQSLVKLRCMSKSWKALIDSKEFMNLHLSRNKSSAENCKIIFVVQAPDRENKTRWSINHLYAADLDLPDKMVTTAVELHHPFKSVCSALSPEFHGSCNGLLCLSNGGFVVVLWNPCLHKHWRLPYSPPSSPKHRPDCASRLILYGFGFDNAADDYKVVRLIQLFDRIRPFHQEVKVYSLKSNFWKKVRPEFPYFVPMCGASDGVLANCAMHWMMCEGDDSVNNLHYVIVALGLRTEKYHLVPHPPSISNREPCNLFILDGCLCALSANWWSFLCIWMMKDYGVKDSWTIVASQPSPRLWSSFSYPIAFSKQEGRGIFFHDEKHVLYYDAEKQLVQKASFLSSASSSIFRGYQFVDSLVKPCGGTSGINNRRDSVVRRSIRIQNRKNAKKVKMM